MKYIKNDYVPKGQLIGFPLEVIDKMIERQTWQGNKSNVKIFEVDVTCSCNDGGFYWLETIEGKRFWVEVLCKKDFDLFFSKYPKRTYPKVMMVSANNHTWRKRVVFMEKKGVYFAWLDVETIEAAEDIMHFASWKYAKDIEPEQQPKLIHLTIEDISAGKGVGIDPKLIRIKQ